MTLPGEERRMTLGVLTVMLIINAIVCAHGLWKSIMTGVPVSVWNLPCWSPSALIGVCGTVTAAALLWKHAISGLSRKTSLEAEEEVKQALALPPNHISKKQRNACTKARRGRGRGRHDPALHTSFTARLSPKARRWRMHESRAQASVSLAQQHQACGVTPISSALTGLISSLAFALAWVCVLPLLWAGQQARYCYMCCLHHLPGYKSELSAAAAKQQIEKAEVQQELLCQLAKQHDTAAKQLAMKDSELAAFQASGQFAQSEVDRVQRQLDALTAAHSDVQHQLDSSAYQSEQMKKRLDAKDAEIATVCASQHSALKEQEQQHQQALHAVEEAAEAMVSAAIDQTATANAAADAAHFSKQSVLRKVQSDRDQLSLAVHQLEQEKAALLSEGLSYMQQLQAFRDEVLWWQQAYGTLHQSAQSQRDQAEQEARAKDQQEEALRLMLQDARENLRQTRLAAVEAEAAKKKMMDQLYPVFPAEAQMQPLAAGSDGTVEVGWNAKFKHHVCKWSSHNEDLDKEARNLLVLRGPHVVQCFGLCQDSPAVQPRHPGKRGLVMELIPQTVYNVLVKAPSITPNWSLKDSVAVGYQTACGLASLHGRGYVHGDFKPDNIGLTVETGSLLVKLLDFGRAQEFTNHSLTWRSSMPLVTMWAPPEYACTFLNGGSDYQLDPAVEVFAFGIVLGQLLDCGLWPTGMTEDEYLQLLANGQYQLPWQTPKHFLRQHEVPEPLKKVVESCLMYNPHHRPSMESVTKCLETILRTL